MGSLLLVLRTVLLAIQLRRPLPLGLSYSIYAPFQQFDELCLGDTVDSGCQVLGICLEVYHFQLDRRHLPIHSSHFIDRRPIVTWYLLPASQPLAPSNLVHILTGHI